MVRIGQPLSKLQTTAGLFRKFVFLIQTEDRRERSCDDITRLVDLATFQKRMSAE